jgi:hypothetical protein
MVEQELTEGFFVISVTSCSLHLVAATTPVPILVLLRGFSSVGQVGVREPPVTSHFSRNNAVMGGTARNKRRRRYENLAQGGGLAEPWVFNVKSGPL